MDALLVKIRAEMTIHRTATRCSRPHPPAPAPGFAGEGESVRVRDD